MKTKTILSRFGCMAVLCLLAIQPAAAQNETVTRGVDVQGADVVGSDVKGADVKGADVQGGSVTPGKVTPGTVTAFAEGREIRVRSLSPTTVNVNGADAEIRLGGQVLLVRKSKLILDGQPLADLPAEVKKVEVETQDGMLSVKGDGKEVAKSKLK